MFRLLPFKPFEYPTAKFSETRCQYVSQIHPAVPDVKLDHVWQHSLNKNTVFKKGMFINSTCLPRLEFWVGLFVFPSGERSWAAQVEEARVWVTLPQYYLSSRVWDINQLKVGMSEAISSGRRLDSLSLLLKFMQVAYYKYVGVYYKMPPWLYNTTLLQDIQ